MSSNQFTFTGKVTFDRLLVNAVLKHEGNDPNIDPNNPGRWSQTWDINSLLSSRPLTWDQQSVPTSLSGITIPQFASSPIWTGAGNSQINTFVTVNGCTANGTGPQNGYTRVSLRDNNGTIFNRTLRIQGFSAADCRQWSNNGPENVNNTVSSFQVPSTALFENVMEKAPALNSYPDSYNVNFAIEVRVTASISCTGRNLDTGVCVNLCTTDQTSITQCTTPYINYCTATNSTTNEPVITSSQNCQNFIENYLARGGPDANFSAPITTYCVGKYRDLKGLIPTPETPNTNVPAIDLQLCACHMDDSQYVNVQNKAEELLPPAARSLYPQVPRCFLPSCVGSRYPALKIPQGGCKVPACLQIQVFENDGSFQGNVVQSQECNASGKPDGVPTWVIVALIVIFIILAVILYTLLDL